MGLGCLSHGPRIPQGVLDGFEGREGRAWSLRRRRVVLPGAVQWRGKKARQSGSFNIFGFRLYPSIGPVSTCARI